VDLPQKHAPFIARLVLLFVNAVSNVWQQSRHKSHWCTLTIWRLTATIWVVPHT